MSGAVRCSSQVPELIWKNKNQAVSVTDLGGLSCEKAVSLICAEIQIKGSEEGAVVS